MSNSCVAALYDSFDKAKDAVQALEHSDFPPAQISMATHSVSKEIEATRPLQFGDQSEIRAVEGAGIGGVLGLLLGTPLLTIPGIGPMLIAGPVATGLTGAIVGGFLGSMAGWGVHEDHVAQYEKKVKSGSLLVVANGKPDEVALAKEILDQTDAEQVNLHVRTSADAPEIDDSLTSGRSG